jgi:predicted ATPase
MLTQLNLRNFKCFENQQLHLSPLTLLTGFNSAGKSTVLQSLCVLHQTVIEQQWSNELMLNGSTISLGTAGDVINDFQGGRSFVFEIGTETGFCSLEMESINPGELAVPIKSLVWKALNKDTNEWKSEEWSAKKSNSTLVKLLPKRISNSKAGQKFTSMLRRIGYINAERSGPRDTYPGNNHSQDINVGIHGEKAPWVLYYRDEASLIRGLIQDDVQPTLQRQAEAWLRIFFPGVRIEVLPIRLTNFVTLSLRMSDREEFHRPHNVGYGITHVLPIISACLCASEEDVILIENPEAHLHPSGQSKMGSFLARAAAAGLQIIVETHSDHILNGVRLAVRGGLIPSKDISLHFFQHKDDNASVISPVINQDGSINDWPQGFFDQLENDLMELL